MEEQNLPKKRQKREPLHFLLLPRELRDEVWNALIPRREIFISHLNTKGPQRKTPRPPGPILNLILACRQMHDEVLDTLYSKTVFSFASLNDLLWLQPPNQFSVQFIRSIKLYMKVQTHSNDTFFREWTKKTLTEAASYFTGLWKMQIILLFDEKVFQDFGKEDWHGHGSGRTVGLRNVFLPIRDIKTLSLVEVNVALHDAYGKRYQQTNGATADVPPDNSAEDVGLVAEEEEMGDDTSETSNGKGDSIEKKEAKLQTLKSWLEKDLTELLEPPKENYPQLLKKNHLLASSTEAENPDQSGLETGRGFKEYLENYLKGLALKC